MNPERTGAVIKAARLKKGLLRNNWQKRFRLQTRLCANGKLEFPKVKDTTSIPRGLLLNRYSRRAG